MIICLRLPEDSPQKIRHKEDSPHWGSWGWGVRVGGLGDGFGGGWGRGAESLNPPTLPSPPQPPGPPPRPITVVWRIFHIGTVANVCPTLTRLRSNSRSHLCLTRCVANLLCGKSSVANLPCGGSSGNLCLQPVTLASINQFSAKNSDLLIVSNSVTVLNCTIS